MSSVVPDYKIICKHKISEDEACQAIVGIHRSVAWGEGHDYLSIERLQEPENLSYFLRKNVDQEIVAYATAKPIKNGYYLSFIAVKSEEQGHKYGTHLMQKIFDKVIKKGATMLCLDFKGDNPQKYHFYDKFNCLHFIQTLEPYADGTPKYQICYDLSGYTPPPRTSY